MRLFYFHLLVGGDGKPNRGLLWFHELRRIKNKKRSILKESNLFCLDTAPLQEKWIIWEMYGPKVS